MEESRPNTATVDRRTRKSARKLGTACLSCHSRKIRCDGAERGLPCSNCASTESHCRPRQRQRRAVRVLSGAGSSSASPGQNTSHNSDQVEVATRDAVQVQVPDLPLSISDESELAKQHLCDFMNQDLSNNPIKERLQYIGTDLSNLYHLIRQNALKATICHYPCSQVYVPRPRKESQPLARPNLIPKDALILPPRHVSDVLIKDYFEFVAPGLPIIDEAAFMAAYNDTNGEPPSLLLQVICLVGAHVNKTFGSTNTLKATFFRRAKALIDGRYEDDRMNTVQAAILMTWMSDGADDVNANSWHWIGLATRTAIGLGMHRDVLPSNMPAADKRLWRRIWWVLMQFDCLASLSHGRPQAINLEDCDVPPLCPDDFDISSHPPHITFVMEHTKLCVIFSKFIRARPSVKAPIDEQARANIDSLLAKWAVQLPENLRIRRKQGLYGTDFWTAMLHTTYNTLLIIVHRLPQIDPVDGKNCNSSDDSDICFDAAGTITQLFEDLRQQDLLRCCWCWASSFFFTTIIEVSVEMRSQNPILATSALTKFDSVMESIKALADYWLYANSILRLFEHSSERLQKHIIDTTHPTPTAAEVTFVNQSALSQGSNIAGGVEDGQTMPGEFYLDQQRLDYANPSPCTNLSGNPVTDDMEWLGGQISWQSSYQGDPLANVRLDDTWGGLEFFWQH